MRIFLITLLAIFCFSNYSSAQFGNTLYHLSSSPGVSNNTLVGLSVHDIDLDGDLDVLASFQSGIFWFENDGQGNFSDGNSIDFQGKPVFKQAQFRDLDGDGKPDLAAGFGWRKNLGNGNFAPETGDFWKEVSGICDLNSDGFGDIFYQSSNVLFLERNLGAVFSPDAYPVANGSNIQFWLAADLDQDQQEDVVASLSNILYWFRNLGDNTFSKIQISTGAFKSVVAGDVDGNGRMDLLGAINGSLSWWEFDGYGNRSLRQTLPLPGFTSATIALGDLDGDKNLDLFTGGMTTPNGSRPAILYFDAVAGQFDPTPYTQPAFSAFCPKAVLADFDGNGRLDIFASLLSTSKFAVFHDTGTHGNFDIPMLVGEPLGDIPQILPADLDKDGDKDFIAADFLFEKTGPGNYAQRRKINLPDANVQLADLDGDGLQDAVYPKNDAVVWQRNLGGLQFGPEIKLDGFVAQCRYVGIADFDGDKDLDLCAGIGTEALSNFSLLLWYENDGMGNFTKHQLQDNITWVLSTQPLDVNSDSLPDIYVELGNLQNDIWYKNLGNGNFAPPQTFFSPGTTEPSYVNQRLLTDLDGDGHTDMVFSTIDYHTTDVYWYRNLDGNGFSDKKLLYTVDHLGSYATAYFAVYDADNDEQPDIILNGSYHRQIIFLRGLGGGNFAPADILYDDPGVGGFFAIAPYDVNDDGGLDLLLGNGASNLTSSNQVSWLSGKGELPPNPAACPRDVLFSRQIEVDSFPIKYPDCKEIQGNLIVYEISANGDPVIYDLSPLLGVHTVHGGVYIYRSFLPNLHGLDSLRTIGGDLEIKGGYVLTSLEGLDNLQSIGGNLVIRQNESLTFQAKLKNLHGLENLERVGGDFIQQERNLLSLEGLDKLRIIGGNFDIQKGKLQSLLGLEALDTIGKSLVLANLPNLKSLSGLQNLHHAGLNLSTDSLPDLQGLENLRSGRELRLTSNKNLQRLTGLENLEQLTGYNRNTLAKYPVIWLANNQALSDLSALDHDLDVDDDGIYILNNAALSQCAAQAICAYLPTEPDTVSIAGNLPACESDVAILASCQLLNTGAPSDNVGYWVFPNPISSAEQLTVVWQSDFNGPVKLELLSLEGRVLKTIIREKFADQITETIPISERLPRQFILRVSDGRTSAVRLVVKL
ncbi:MAG: VCBS repeat-containing protein [Saprospiraceae bacterium]|nr:VCBS repeat-containing protein [Saprospiraceae bacterium]